MVEKIAVELFKALGWPALFLIIGAGLDFFTSSDFKSVVAARISENSLLTGPNHIIRFFNAGLLSIFPGNKPSSFRFILRSAVISLVALGAVILTQTFISNLNVFKLLNIENSISSIYIGILISCNVVTDYVANACTISLLRLAEEAKSRFDLFVIAIANVFLTITIFSFIFPVGIVLCLIVGEFGEVTSNFQLRQTGASIASQSVTRITDPGSALLYEVKTSTIIPIKASRPTNGGIGVLTIVSNKEDSRYLSKAAHFLSSDDSEVLIFGDTDAAFPVTLEKDNQSFATVAAMYKAAFGAVEEIRNNFIGMLEMQTVMINISGLFGLESTRGSAFDNLTEGRVLCKVGAKKTVYYEPGNISGFIKNAIDKCRGPVQVAISLSGPGDFRDQLRALSSVDTQVPLAALFLSSFAISLVYYLAIAITGCGLLLNKSVSRLFGSKRIRSSEIPFTILGVLCFAPSVLLVLVFRSVL